jgi:MFS transporter, NNP family, nitrate/nitrite transporter
MPAIYNSLVSDGLTDHQAWRVAYVVPFIIIVAISLGMAFTCDDTPTGKWSQRHLAGTATPITTMSAPDQKDTFSSGATTPKTMQEKMQPDLDTEAQVESSRGGILEELVVAPTWKETLQVIYSLPTLSLAVLYACTFGAELSFDSSLGSYYTKNFPSMGQTKSGEWAAMFGLLNVVTRPLGGYVADYLYRHTKSVWVKKIWLTFLTLVSGAFLVAIGLTNPKSESTMFGLVAGSAFFMEAANGANFALVPHVYPFANGM